MKNFTFMLWVLLWPLICSIESYFIHLEGETYSDTVELITSVIYLCVWIKIGKLLYKKD